MKIKYSFLVILTVILSIACVALIVAVALLATRDNSDLVETVETQVCNDYCDGRNPRLALGVQSRSPVNVRLFGREITLNSDSDNTEFTTALCALCALNNGAFHRYASTIRPPAFPLAVRAPYSNYWLRDNVLPGNWPTFWTTTIKGWTGMVRVDGQAYVFMGNPSGLIGLIQVGVQKASYITPTQTIFVINVGLVELQVTFMSPVEYNDIRRQSIPLSYVLINARSIDEATHQVEVYMDISGEWASSDVNNIVRWGLTTGDSVKTWSVSMLNQLHFSEYDDYAQWGSAVLTTTDGATHQSGNDRDVRYQFVSSGRLSNTHDDDYRCVSCGWPIVAFSHNLGVVGSTVQRELQFTIGHIREENINLREIPQKALWTHYFSDMQAMIWFFFSDIDHAKQYCDELDDRLLTQAYAVGGQDYANIISLSLRQAVAGTELSGTPEEPLLYQKEISSNGNMQTVDVMYPAVPMWYFLNVTNLQYLLEPLFYQMESGFWPRDFSMHDIGFHYPNATGHDDGDEEDMPVEESANMLLMVADISLHPKADVGKSRDYIRKHFSIMSQWADYLFFNCLYPVNQLTTDDFIGHTQLNSGLALKGILGMKAFARLAELIGETNATRFYDNAVSEFVPIWYSESIHASGSHLKMEYNVTEGYQFKYNAFQDKLLNLSTVPEEVYQMEAAFYLTKEEAYGIPFVFTHDYTKSDWEMWTAAAFGDASPVLRQHIIENMARFLRDTPSRVPFSDWYVTATAKMVGFQARPVAGGHFALLARSQYV